MVIVKMEMDVEPIDELAAFIAIYDNKANGECEEEMFVVSNFDELAKEIENRRMGREFVELYREVPIRIFAEEKKEGKRKK